jgi:hypothetical protein
MGKQIIVTPERIANSEYIDINTAAKKQYLCLSKRMVAHLCQRGFFKSAFKGGTQSRSSKWKILRSEVLAHRINGHFHPDNY